MSHKRDEGLQRPRALTSPLMTLITPVGGSTVSPPGRTIVNCGHHANAAATARQTPAGMVGGKGAGEEAERNQGMYTGDNNENEHECEGQRHLLHP